MGNARWVGVPLRAVLEKAGVLPGAKQVAMNGLDTPVLPQTPDFIKALDIDLALSAEPIVAWSMNGADIPFLNGYPIKLIVPGYFGTYWVKHLSEIVVMDHGFDGFFMSTAYRVPDNACQCVPAGTAPTATRPLTTLPVRSFITSVAGGARVPALANRCSSKALPLTAAAASARWKSPKTGSNGARPRLGKDLGKLFIPRMALWRDAAAQGRVQAAGAGHQRQGRRAARHGQLEPRRLCAQRR
jgi:sulfite dehydrogenase